MKATESPQHSHVLVHVVKRSDSGSIIEKSSEVHSCVGAAPLKTSHPNGWKLANNALRQELGCIQAVVDTLAKQVGAGDSLSRQQVDSFWQLWLHLEEFVLQQHRAEQEVLFPWLRTRAELPGDLSQSLQVLQGQLHCCSTAAAQLQSTLNIKDDGVLLIDFLAAYTSFKRSMEFHLHRVEQQLLPLIKRLFSPDEMKAVAVEMVNVLSLPQQAALYCSMDDSTKDIFLKDVMGVSWMVKTLKVDPAMKRHERMMGRLLQDIIGSSSWAEY